VATAIQNLYEHYKSLADSVTDTTAQLEALEAIERWKGAVEAAKTIGDKTMQSYSIAGRSFTFRDAAHARAEANAAKAEFLSILGIAGGGTAFSDFSDGRAS